MLLGMSLHAFTVFHVVLSLIGIGSGLVVVYGFIDKRDFKLWTLLFLTTTAATSVTGFLFPVKQVLPSHAIGILTLVALTGAAFARYPMGSAGRRRVYVMCSVIALWFNVFVLVAQLFKHVPALEALAPTQTEIPFSAAQLIVAAVFIVLGILSLKRFCIVAR